MTDIKKIEQELRKPFPASEVKWRAQQIRKKFKKDEKEKDKYEAIMLAYIDARAVMDRLDEAVGVNNWQSTFTETDKGRVLCSLSIKFGDEWVTKTDGAGDTGTEGEKGAISDALKRAAVNFGINRAMYNFGDTRVELQPKDVTINRNGKPIHKWGAAKLSEKCRLPDWYSELLKQKPEQQNVIQQPVQEVVKQHSEEEVQKKWDEMLVSLKETFAHDKEDYKSRYNTIQRTLEKMVEGGDPEFKRRLAYIKQINFCIKEYKQENKQVDD